MKKKENGQFVKLGITGGAVVLFGVSLWFIYSHASGIGSFFGSVLKILMPFVYGAVIAYILSPLCSRLERFFLRYFPRKKGLCSALSMVLSYAAALAVIIVLLLLVVPNVIQSIVQIVAVLPSQIRTAAAWLHNMLETYPDLQDSWDTFSADLMADITAWLQTDFLTSAQTLLMGLSVQVTGIANLVKNLFLGVLISVYLMGSRRKFARQAKLLTAGIFPKKWADAIEEEVRYADRMFNGFLVGRVIDSVIIGIICFVFSVICRFDAAVLVSVVVGVTNIIPVFGPFLGAIPCALILVLENPLHCLMFLIFIVVLQLVDGNVIGPRILGQTTGVSSFWVLFAVMLFGGLWGIVGMIIGVPLFAVIYDIVKKLVYHGLNRHRREDLTARREAQPENRSAEPGKGEQQLPAGKEE